MGITVVLTSETYYQNARRQSRNKAGFMTGTGEGLRMYCAAVMIVLTYSLLFICMSATSDLFWYELETKY